jgi:hypothetical protein
VTKPGANLFLELGFAPDGAGRLQVASHKQRNDALLLKQPLMEELSVWIAKHHAQPRRQTCQAGNRLTM